MALTAPSSLRLTRPNAGIDFASQEELEQYIRGVDSVESPYQGLRTIEELRAAQNEWHLDHSGLGQYQSKYNTFEPVPGHPGMFRATLQQPGKHKYDTMEAFYKVDPATGQASLVGTPTATRQQSSTKQFVKQDLPFALAAAAPFLAPGISALHGVGGALGNAITGATIGGGIPLLTGGNTQDILRGGIAGGVGGYASHEMFGPMGEVGGPGGVSDADFERLYGPIPTDAPSAASLPGGSAAGLGSLPTGGAPQITITGSQLPQLAGAVPALAAAPAYATPVTPGGPSPEQVQQIEVTGQQETQQPNPVPMVGPIGPGPGQVPNIPTAQLDPPSTSQTPVNQGQGMGDKFMEWAKKNPIQALQLLGGLGSLAGVGGSGGQGGAPGAGNQSDLTAQKAPKFQRQYVAPPPGYRPGFDPEHRYFTGIGTVGTGG
jgi:hypothetical protein